MVTTRHGVTPILDIQSVEFARQYQLGSYWARYGDEQGNAPQPDAYFIASVTTLIESGHFNDLRSAWFPNLGFFLGLVHGAVLNPRTGELWPDVTTLVTLSNPSVTRGYRAGRIWFFYEADPDERRLTDIHLMQRLHELAVERHQYQDEANTINFALGCVIGELSGQLFPLMQEEQESIQEENRQFMIEYEAQLTKAARSAIPNLCT